MQHPITLIRSAEPLSYIPVTELQVTTFSYEKVGIDEVRLITQQANLRPAEGEDFIFLIGTHFVTHEAQNALLKLFEEPPTGLQFQLILPAGVGLLPTLMSRIGQEITHATNADNSAWVTFIAATPAERLKQIDAWQKNKEPEWLQTIARGVQTVKSTDVPVGALPVVQIVSERLATRGASNKMLLEHLALVLPLRKL